MPIVAAGVLPPLAWDEAEPLSRAESRMSRIVRVGPLWKYGDGTGVNG